MTGGRVLRLTLGLVVAVILGLAALPLALDAESEVLDAEARRGVPGRFAELSAGVTHYEVAGPRSGLPIVFIHGGSVPYYIWDETFAALADSGYRVLRYDQFGRGYSDRPDAVYGRELLEGQLEELLDTVGVERPVVLAGVSLGGALAVSFTESHPGRVRGLILEDPLNQAVDVGALKLPLLGPWLMAVLVAPSLPEDQLHDFYEPARFPNWPDRYRPQMRFRGFRRATLSLYRTYLAVDHRALYRRVGRRGLPTLLIWGQEDAIVPFTDSDAVRALLSPEFVPVPRAGHLPHKERPGLVNGAILEFLAGLRDPGSGTPVDGGLP